MEMVAAPARPSREASGRSSAEHAQAPRLLDRPDPRPIPIRLLGSDKVLAVVAEDDPGQPPALDGERGIADRPAGPVESRQGLLGAAGPVAGVEPVPGRPRSAFRRRWIGPG
jgi:hypothetical protein